MPTESPRIAELRRRVESDPASIAFAQLAEEYRRGGAYDEAVRSCRDGLHHHPGYLSARVTLGRALIELGDLEGAETELDLVLRTAPDNLAAIRGMGEIFQRRGRIGEALTFYRRALQLARHDPELEDAVDHLTREIGGVSADKPSAPGLSLEQLEQELLGLGGPPVPVTPAPAPPPPPAPVRVEAPLPAEAGRASVELDDIFEALGGRGEEVPPQVEAILNPQAVPEPLPAVDAPSSYMQGLPMVDPEAADDLLAELESDLRKLVDRRADLTARPQLDEAEQEVLSQLEAWLEAIESDRLRRTPIGRAQ